MIFFLRWILSACLILNSLPTPVMAQNNPVAQSAEQVAGAKLPFKSEHHTDKWISMMLTASFVTLLGTSWMKYKIGDLVADFWIAVIATGLLVLGDLITNELWISDMEALQGAVLGTASGASASEQSVDGQQLTREAQIKSYQNTQNMLGTRMLFYGLASLTFVIASVVSLANAFNHATATEKLKTEVEQVLKKDIPANAKAKVLQECASKSAGNTTATQACTQAIMSAEVDPCIKSVEKFYAGYLNFVDQWKNEEKISKIRCKEMETWKKMWHILSAQCKDRMRDFQNANKIDLESKKHMDTTEGLFMCLAQDSAEKEEQKNKELQEKFEKEFDPSEIKEGPKGDFNVPSDRQVSKPTWLELLIPVAQAQEPSNFSMDWINGIIAGDKGPSTFMGVGMGVAMVAFFQFFNEKIDPMLDEFWASPILRAVIYGAASLLLIAAMVIQGNTIHEMGVNIEKLQGTSSNEFPNSDTRENQNMKKGHDSVTHRMSSNQKSLAATLEHVSMKKPVVIPCPKNNCDQLSSQKIFPNPNQRPPSSVMSFIDSLKPLIRGISGKRKPDSAALFEIEKLNSQRGAIQKDIDLYKQQLLSKHPSLNASILEKKQNSIMGKISSIINEVAQKFSLTGIGGLMAAVKMNPSIPSAPPANLPGRDSLTDQNADNSARGGEQFTGNSQSNDDEGTGGLSMGTTGGVEVAGSDMSEYERELKQVANSEGFDYASAAKEQDDIHPVAQDGLFDLISRRYQRSHLFKNLE